MKCHWNSIQILALLVLSSHAWAQNLSCEQIRTEINIQTSSATTINTELLRKISGRTDCRFTASEVYRAAYGDKPQVPSEVKRERTEHDEDD